LPQHEILEGSVDDLNRPLVRIEATGFADPLVAFIDTGFNGAILIDETQATMPRRRSSGHGGAASFKAAMA
jgi:hypothetical protein